MAYIVPMHVKPKFTYLLTCDPRNPCNQERSSKSHWNGRRVVCSRYFKIDVALWRHQMETISALLAIYAGNSLVTGDFPAQRSVTRSFDVFFDLRLNKRLRKQSWGWWFETPSRPLWRHCNGFCLLTWTILKYAGWIDHTNKMPNDCSSFHCK